MSDEPPVQPSGQRPGRNPFVTALLIFIGVILLLPGLCAIILTAMVLQEPSGFSNINVGEDIAPLAIFFMIGVGGVALIVFAIRRR